MPVAKQRPVYLNLVKIRLPLPGIVSILHRASGLILFILLPFLLFLLEKSLSSPMAYINLTAIFSHVLVKLVLLGLGWAFFHHLFCGIRYLIIDVVHSASELTWARQSSVVVLVVSLALTVMLGVRLW